jgi:hypothetical protein
MKNDSVAVCLMERGNMKFFPELAVLKGDNEDLSATDYVMENIWEMNLS